ncbi:oxidoreductase [Sphingomonas sp. DBB INV C78]|uniref:Gfo/Idh/MocA family protein n=1 Tax=Sphingomonas sp. DBB INV C78 TaxID=3349434 RepID=UPI0036D2A892
MTGLRYGVIGTGLMGQEHIRNIQLLPGARITAIADPEPASLIAAGCRDAAHFTDAESFAAAADVDAVIVASPNHTHREVLEPLFARGLPILCEKPIATTVADAAWIVDRARRHPAPFWTGMEYRYMPPARRFIAQVHEGRAGRLVMLAIREHRFPFLDKVGQWNRLSRNTGGTMVEKCCHFFDLMRHIIRAEPVRVFCSGGVDVNHADERIEGQRPDIIDNSYTVVDFDNGVRAMLDLCMFADGAEHQEEISATGDTARIDLMVPPGDIIFSPRVGYGNAKQAVREHVDVEAAALAAGEHFGATWHQHLAFARAVKGEGPVEVTAEDGLRAVAMGVAAEISAREKRAVEMSEVLGVRLAA